MKENITEKELDAISGGADLPSYENPSCQWCNAPASYVTFEIQTPIGTQRFEKYIFCPECIARRAEEIEHAGGKVININAVL